MPLSKNPDGHSQAPRLHRDPESYVAGARALNSAGPRYSRDIDVFHGREERAASAAASDTQTLEAAGYGVR
ncbi:MAG: hypothetical protein JO307_18505 [Bryobacterales bacterium]|nr:hypothetical protein [Bryobacterales bacterium]MBV9398190.1 hypothetical protein [Bryobacterales bacterium]